MNRQGIIVTVCKKSEPGLPKYEVDEIRIIENHGIEDDYHAGKFIRHRWLAKQYPTKPNHRQVLMTDTSIYDAITQNGIHLEPGMLGENIIIDGISVMQLPIGTKLQINEALLEITEIREPCYQLNKMYPELQDFVMPDKKDEKTWNAGMMAIVLTGGVVRPEDIVKVKNN